MILTQSSQQSALLPGNFLIFLQPLNKIIPNLPVKSDLSSKYEENAIAYYLSTFDYVIIDPSLLENDLVNNNQIIQMAYSYNKNIKFYAYIDGMDIIDSEGGMPPSEQLDLKINRILFNYNTKTGYNAITGIYIDNFEFLNVGIGVNHKQTFRDLQIYSLLICNQNSLYLAASCPGKYASNDLGAGGYQFITNLPYILNYTYDKSYINQLIQFTSTFTLIDYNLFGYDFNFNSASWTGYTEKIKFFNTLSLLNGVLTDPFNISCKFSMAITTDNLLSYSSPSFFNQNKQVGGTGVANVFYNVAALLSAGNVATSASKDFYQDDKNPTNNVVFDFDSINYYPRSKLKIMNQNTIAFVSNPSIGLTITGADTSTLIINGFDPIGSRAVWI